MNYFTFNQLLGSLTAFSSVGCVPFQLSTKIERQNISFNYVDGINAFYRTSNDINHNYSADSFAYNGDAIPQLHI